MISFKVSEFVDYLREHLRTTVGEVVVQGEVTGFRERGDSLVFFDLKDEGSSVTCFLMKYELTVALEDGMEVKVLAVPSLFKKSGKFHLKVKEITPVGEGALRKALLKLVEKLTMEGLLAEQRKRPGEALAHWKQALAVLMGIKNRGGHVSPADLSVLAQLRQKVGGK